MRKMFGRYDVASFSGFAVFAVCSLSIPLVMVAMGKDLAFPMDGGGMGQGGVLHMVRSAMMVIAILTSGAMAGYFGKRRLMGYATLFMGIGVLCCAFSPAYVFLLPCLAVAGLAEGLIEGIATPFVEALHPEEPERYINIAHGFWSVGIGICVIVVGGLLALGVDWRVVLGICGGLTMLISLLFLWRENPKKRYPETTSKRPPLEILNLSVAIFKRPRFWFICLGMFMGAGAEFCLTFWATTYMQLNFNAGPWVAGLGTGAIALGMFVGRTVFGIFARKEYLKHLLLAASLGTIPITLLFVWITPELIPSTSLLFTLLFTLLFLSGIGISPYWPSLQVHGVTSLKELDSTMLYIYFSAVGIPGCGFFTWFIGVLGDMYGLRAAFLLIPISLVGFATIVFLEGWVFKNKKPLQ